MTPQPDGRGKSLCIGVTGASGFVGSGLLERLARERYNVVALVRRPGVLQGAAARAIGDLEKAEGLTDALKGVDVLIHLAAGQTFLASDGEDLSTPDLIRKIASAMSRPARLWPVPLSILRLFGRIIGRRDEIEVHDMPVGFDQLGQVLTVCAIR